MGKTIYINNILPIYQDLKKRGLPFRYETTRSGSQSIITSNIRYVELKGKPIDKRFLFFFKQVSNEIITRYKEQYGEVRDDFDFSKGLGVNINYHYSNTAQYIDIAAAYPRTAYHLGLLSDATFFKIMELPKHIRLKIIGNIAKVKRVRVFEGGKCVKDEQIYDEWGRYAWSFIQEGVFNNFINVFLSYGKTLSYYIDNVITALSHDKVQHILMYDLPDVYQYHYFTIYDWQTESKRSYVKESFELANETKTRIYSNRYLFKQY